MPLQKVNSLNRLPLSDKHIVDLINSVIDYTNALEARLAALEHPIERLSEETRPINPSQAKFYCPRCANHVNTGGHTCIPVNSTGFPKKDSLTN